MSEIVHVAEKAMRMMFGERCDLQFVLLSCPGSSGARVSIFRHSRTGLLYAVKCVQGSRVSLMDEVARREFLVPYLGHHLPKVLWCQVVDGFEVMVSECTGTHTLHHFIMSGGVPQSRLLALWREVVETLAHIWERSQHEYREALCPRFFPARLGRIQAGLRAARVGDVQLSDCWDMPVIVNGEEYSSLGKSFGEITLVGKPKTGVVCHGDPQPSNIVVGSHNTWYCVDWEWAGPHQDWRMLFTHLYGWWSTRCLVIDAEPRVRVAGNRLEIEHDASTPAHLRAYQEVASRAAMRMSHGLLSQETVNDINRYLAMLYFGEMRFLHLWGRDAFAASMLAQGVVTVSGSGGGEYARPFQFQKMEETCIGSS